VVLLTLWNSLKSCGVLKKYPNKNSLLIFQLITNVKDTYNESLTYDKNGNIKSLQRNGGEELATHAIEIDHLIYTYESTLHSNQLKSVANSSGSTQGFKDIAGNDYLYERGTSEAIFSIICKHKKKAVTFSCGFFLTQLHDYSP